MNIVNEDLYTSDVDYKCFTSNGVLNSKKDLVMGAGTAKIVKQMYPELPAYFGNTLYEGKFIYDYKTDCYKYGVLINNKYKIIAVQTKYHWKQPSDVKLIEYSMNKLSILAKSNPTKLFGCPVPGIGLGRIELKHIEYILEVLPPNIILFQKA